ncbi:MAG TPA: VIT domain-containing protein [Gemmataceae bacterium]|nr:VIT domain-containing protein [Gemmataceae bacterium]
MRRYLSVLVVLLVWSGSIHAHGLLIPEEKSLPPLAMLNHKVRITIDDQLSITHVEQTFRNHTDRQLEATYIFPVPKGASVNRFSMWVDGKETKGELVEAKKARDIYTSIVRRTQDPGLLEYMGNNLLRLRVFPIPPKGDQKVALSFTSVASKEGKLVEYIYPLKTNGKATSTLEDFSITATIKSEHNVTNVYSPTHSISLKRANDKEVTVTFDKNQGILDKDFQLFYATGDKDVGLTVLTHRPLSSENGYFTLLITPRVEIPKEYQVPRDVVLVLDTSGSMRGAKMEQARKALKYCLDNLGAKDRFGLINFATTVNRYEDKLLEANAEQLGKAKKWVEQLEATGGTAINDALASALELRAKEEGRTFTVVFFTDGQPTIGETEPEKILKNTIAKNTANTRIFTFGVGDDVNATMLDQLADKTRALSTYVRPAEDIENKVSGLYSKISNPVLTNLKLSATNDIKFSEVYPAELPDLFHGGQLVVLGRFSGKGPAAIKLTGQVGKETKEFVYELTFPAKTNDDREFVEHLWARRKVGYMLDQIRANGEKKELVQEVIALAKKYGITTPYTSYLIVPDSVMPVAGAGQGGHGRPFLDGRKAPAGLAPRTPTSAPLPVVEFAKENQAKPGDLAVNRGARADKDLAKGEAKDAEGKAREAARDKKQAYDRARELLQRRAIDGVQAGKLGVDLSCQMQNLRNQTRLDQTALRNVYGRNCLEIGGVWIDEGFDAKMPTLVVKAQSDAYFKLLEQQPKLRSVFKLGNHLVWVAPNGTALVIDTANGKDKLSDEEISKLFVVKK